MVEAQSLTANTNQCLIKLFTNIAFNTFKFTHILYQVSTFTFKPIYYSKVYAADSSFSYVSSIDVSSIFSTPSYSKCIIGISYNVLTSPYSACGTVMQITESASTISYALTFTYTTTLYSVFC
jgi:hypothetical protein